MIPGDRQSGGRHGVRLSEDAPEYALYALGVLIAVSSLTQILLTPGEVLLFPHVAVPLVLALVPIWVGWRVRDDERARTLTANILRVIAVFTLAGLFTTGVVVTAQVLSGDPVLDLPFGVVLTVSMGAALGAVGGFYYDELVVKRRAAEAESERARSLNQRLKVVNRVLRHNVRTELTVISGHLSVLLEELDADEDRHIDSSAECQAALARLERLIEKTRRTDALAATDTVVHDVVPTIRRHLTSLEADYPDVTFTSELPPTASVRAHPLIETAIVEAIDNAVRHNDGADLTVTVSVDARRTDAGHVVDVMVADTGDGIPDYELDTIEQGLESPLQHTSGVGLWFLKWVAEESHGDLTFAPNEPSGTVVRLTVPRAMGEGLSTRTVQELTDILTERRSTVDGRVERSVLSDR